MVSGCQSQGKIKNKVVFPMPIANPPKRNIGKTEFCQCSNNRLTGWAIHLKDQYCSECGEFLYSLDFKSSSIDQKCELQHGVFLIESLGNDIQIRSNLQISKKTTTSNKDIINFNDEGYSFCKEAEIIIKETNKRYFLSLREDFAKKGTLSFSINPIDNEEMVQQALDLNLKKVTFKCYKNRNLPRPELTCDGILGPFPTENPFEILICGDLPVIANGCLNWKFTALNLNRLDISWKVRYPFKLIGAYWGNGQPFQPFDKKHYATGEFGQFSIKLKDNEHHLFPFKFKVNLVGVDKATSVFEYSCLIEKINSDLISLIADTDCKIPIKSGGTIPYEAFIFLRNKKSDDLHITNIQIKDDKSCVKLTTLLPLSVKNERTPISFTIQTKFFDRVRDTLTFYPIEVVIFDNKGNKWFQKLNLTLIREEALDHYLAIDWGTTNTCCTIFDPKTSTFKQLTDHGKKYISSISSRFAIRKVDIKNQKYDLIVGSADSLKTDFQGKPECIISSLKRKFYNPNPEIEVYDADLTKSIITTMDLAVEYLQALIIAVEEKSSFEFKKIGFSYPTKIEKKHYTKLIEMLEKLEHSLQKVKPGVTVTTLPNYLRIEEVKNEICTPLPNFKEDKNNNQMSHTPDEACSVAIEYCNSNELKISDGPQILVVYDFGGGTIDSAVIKVFHDGEKFCSSLIGISGTTEFGGDDISNAIVQLIREKIFKFEPKVYIPIFDERTKKDSTDIGKKNRALLFDIMEKHKKDFKISGDKETPISFLGCLTQIKCENGKSAYESLFKDSVDLTSAQKSNLQFFPSEVYDWEIGPGNDENSGLKIRQIIQRSVDELQNICDIEQIKPSKVILAGQGCNLPLVKDIFNKRFPRLIDFDKDKAKTRLSVGLSIFLNSHDTNNDGIFSSFYPMPFVNHFTLGFKSKASSFEKLVSIGSALHASDIKQGFSFPLELPCNPTLDLFRKNYRNNLIQKIGAFDFRKPEVSEENFSRDLFNTIKIIQGFPEPAMGTAKGHLFFRNFIDIFLVLNWKNQYYGCFKIKYVNDYLDLQHAVQGR